MVSVRTGIGYLIYYLDDRLNDLNFVVRSQVKSKLSDPVKATAELEKMLKGTLTDEDTRIVYAFLVGENYKYGLLATAKIGNDNMAKVRAGVNHQLTLYRNRERDRYKKAGIPVPQSETAISAADPCEGEPAQAAAPVVVMPVAMPKGQSKLQKAGGKLIKFFKKEKDQDDAPVAGQTWSLPLVLPAFEGTSDVGPCIDPDGLRAAVRPVWPVYVGVALLAAMAVYFTVQHKRRRLK